jgi:hypothetical protein
MRHRQGTLAPPLQGLFTGELGRLNYPSFVVRYACTDKHIDVLFRASCFALLRSCRFCGEEDGTYATPIELRMHIFYAHPSKAMLPTKGFP